MPVRCVLRTLALFLAAAPALAAAGADVDFAREVEPILAERCHRCHGARKQESGLRLDTPDGLRKGGERGPAAVPGKSGESLLVRAITGADAEIGRMPPKGEPLTAAEIATLRRWIDAGAAWPEGAGTTAARRDHWAFRAAESPPVPAVANPGWARGAIDRFVLARLDREGLEPSPQAGPLTLARRASLDIAGLPPAVEEADELAADPSPDAYERYLDRLLASPHLGERWGRLWLDAARYADSDGYEKDKARSVWFYREWVIGAFNRDLPYDAFITQQLAGDLLPGAEQDEIVATGYLRNSMVNEEGGIDPEQFRMEAMFDRMDAIGKGILGLTIQCAQCHDHKFDPLKQEDYYRLFAFINNDHEANIAVYTPAEEMLRAEIHREIEAIEAGLRERCPDWEERQARWEDAMRLGQPEWRVVRLAAEDISTGGQKYLPQEDGSLLAQGYAPTKSRVKLTGTTDAATITALRLELLNDPNLPLGGPGRSIWGTCALTEIEVHAAPAASPQKPVKVSIQAATADINPEEKPLDAIYDDRSNKRRVTGPVSYALDGKDDTAWGIDTDPGRRNVERQAVFTAAEPIAHPGGTVLTVYLTQNHGGWNSDDNQNHNLGRFRIAVTDAPQAAADLLPRRAREALGVPRSERTRAQTAALFAAWRTSVPELADANARIEALWRSHPASSSQLVLAQRSKARDTRILRRGDFLKPDRDVSPGAPSFLHPMPAGAPPTRLGLAQWIVDRRSPTTARAMVNRLWQGIFGTGLVATSEDLGVQSEPPSHPELLDRLAVDLMDRGWSVKESLRSILASAAYRQSSRITPDLLSRDPLNRLLARGPRLRVDAESVRDVALAASGLLDPRVGGRSVYPPLPAFLLEPPVSYGPKVWHQETGGERYRRALYTFRYRSLPYPVLQAFDAPNGDFACVRRPRSNTPIQALMTLNEPESLACARALAHVSLKADGASDAERIIFAFRRSVTRPPEPEESAALLELLALERAHFKSDEAAARELAGAKGDGQSAGAEAAEIAAWTVVARVLLSLDETISKD